MRVAGIVCIVVGLVVVIGVRSAGRSERAAAAWTPYNKVRAGVAGVASIVVGILLVSGPE